MSKQSTCLYAFTLSGVNTKAWALLRRCLNTVVLEAARNLFISFLSDHNNRTALHVAAMRGSKRCVECILKYHPQSINLLDKNQVWQSEQALFP